MLLYKSLFLLSAVLKLSSNNILVWPKNMFKLPLLTTIKILLLLANSLLLSKFHLNFQANGFFKAIHIHFGAIRLALSYHGRKGIPVAVRLALLNTRYLEYQHTCIGSLETTLNCVTVVVTFYPNFNMALDEPQLNHFLKIQL